MRTLTIYLLAAATVFLSGCASHDGNSLERGVQISYCDRNSDSKVDIEKHQYPGVYDANWELRDDDYDGRYEKKILYGFGGNESPVDIRVPTGVKIETKSLCPKCGAKLFFAYPGLTSTNEIVQFARDSKLKDRDEIMTSAWIHPGVYCPNGDYSIWFRLPPAN